jgi:tetratricopeptide (TPR) repeat protein
VLHTHALQAIRYFLASLAECGEHHVTHYNLGLCHNYLGQYDKALERFNKSVEQSPEYHEAREWQLRMKVQLKR